MRLLIYHPWAALESRRRLYRLMAARLDWDVHFLTLKSWIDDYGRPVAAPLVSDGDGTALRTVFPGNIPLHMVGERLGPHLRRLRPDAMYVYHEPYGVATFQVALANRLSARVPLAIRSAQNIDKAYPPPFRYMESFVYKTSAFAITVSTDVEEVLRAKGFARPVFTVPMALAEDYSGVPVGREGQTVDSPRVAFVGRLVPEKGLDLVLDALTRIDHLELVVVGGGPQERELKAQASSLGISSRVQWLGVATSEGVRRVLGQVDLLVVPSRTTERWREQFGRVVIEAGATGVPAIASDSGELPRLVAAIGTGWIFREGDSSDLADKLRLAVAATHSLRRTRSILSERVNNLFSEVAVSEQLAEALGAGFSRWITHSGGTRF